MKSRPFNISTDRPLSPSRVGSGTRTDRGLFATPRLALGLLLLASALLAGPQPAEGASAAPPNLMPYQGFLVDGNGSPLAPATPLNYPVAFRIYLAPTGGAPLWAEQQVVTVDKGSFSVLLGEGTDLGGEPRPSLASVFAGATASDRFLGISITLEGRATEILPRLRLMPSPYAFLAASAANLVQPNGTPVVSYSGSQVAIAGNVTASGTVSATGFSGSGAGLTGLTAAQIPNIDASKITSGVVGEARIPAELGGTRNFTGSVGIRTGTPGKPLQIGDAAVANAEGMIRLASRSGSGGANRIWDVGVPETDENLSGVGYSFVVDDTQRPGAEFVVRFGTGAVGIGVDAPGFPLSFGNVLGDKISLWGQSGNHFGFGIQSSTLQVHTDGPASDVTFGHGSSAQMTETMRVKGNGNVGIGTTTPTAKLDVNGTVAVRGERPFHFQTFALGTGGNINTGWSTTRYAVSIVGFQTSNGDINEDGAASPPIAVRAYQSGGTWWLQADIKSHFQNETWTVQAMRVVRELVTDTSTFF